MRRREPNATLWVTATAVALSVGLAVTAVAWPRVKAVGLNAVVPALPLPTATPDASDPTSWATFEDFDQLGLRFHYPRSPQYLPSFNGTMSWQVGSWQVEIRDALLIEAQQSIPYDQVFRAVLATPGMPRHDRCCGYAGPPLDYTRPEAQLASAIASHLGQISGLRRTTVGGRTALAFSHLERQDTAAGTWLWATRSYLLPSPQPPYAHLLVTGPALLVERIGHQGDDSAQRNAEVERRGWALLEQLASEPWPLPPDIGRRWQVFEGMVQSMAFPAL